MYNTWLLGVQITKDFFRSWSLSMITTNRKAFILIVCGSGFLYPCPRAVLFCVLIIYLTKFIKNKQNVYQINEYKEIYGWVRTRLDVKWNWIISSSIMGLYFIKFNLCGVERCILLYFYSPLSYSSLMVYIIVGYQHSQDMQLHYNCSWCNKAYNTQTSNRERAWGIWHQVNLWWSQI